MYYPKPFPALEIATLKSQKPFPGFSWPYEPWLNCLPSVVSSDRTCGECVVVNMNSPSNSDNVTERTPCLCQCSVLVFESVVNKDAILSLYLECWAVWTCDSCRRSAAHSILHWWWWLSPGNTSTDMYFHFILFSQTGSFCIKTNFWAGKWSKVHSNVLI